MALLRRPGPRAGRRRPGFRAGRGGLVSLVVSAARGRPVLPPGLHTCPGARPPTGPRRPAPPATGIPPAPVGSPLRPDPAGGPHRRGGGGRSPVLAPGGNAAR